MFLHLQKRHKGGGKAHSWLPHHPFLQVYRDQLILKCVRRKGWKDTKDSYIRKKNYSAYQQQNHASSFLMSQRAQPCRIWKLLPSSSTMSTQNAARVLAECLQSPAIELNYRAVHPSTGSNFLCRWISLFSKDFSKRSLTQLLMARPGKVFLRTLLLIHFKFLMQTS